MKNVLVAGGNGLVGSAVLRSAPTDIVIFAPLRSELDLSDKKEVGAYISRHSIDTIVMAAAKVGGILANSQNHLNFLNENLILQDSIFTAAYENNIENFAFLGSSCIYPKHANQPISELELLTGPLEETNEAYALAKIIGVKTIQYMHENSKSNYFSLMPSNLYGPNDNFNLESSHVPAALMRKIYEAKRTQNKGYTIWGTGSVLREFLYVDDLASAIWYFINNGLAAGKIVNIGTGSDLSIFDFATLLSSVIGYSGQIEFDSSKPDGTPRKLLDVSLAKSLGWESKIELRTGLEKTYTWFVKAYEEGALRGL